MRGAAVASVWAMAMLLGLQSAAFGQAGSGFEKVEPKEIPKEALATLTGLITYQLRMDAHATLNTGIRKHEKLGEWRVCLYVENEKDFTLLKQMISEKAYATVTGILNDDQTLMKVKSIESHGRKRPKADRNKEFIKH
jgi:DNA-binding transcriptional regulator YdaS (Cro superfamily)